MNFKAVADSLPATVEEQRLEAAQAAMPVVFDRSEGLIVNIKEACLKAQSFTALKQCIGDAGSKLWVLGKIGIDSNHDDRTLYWARLQITLFLRETEFPFSATNKQRLALIEILEENSRGRNDIVFKTNNVKKILLTGFDPFLLDRNIDQSNPSGVAALLLDGKIIRYRRQKVEIQTVLFPVRFADFDAGELESLLEPYLVQNAENKVDMIVTVSMGRKEFDLEHFPGRRRSSKSPDNLNIYSGGNETAPKIPSLDGQFLEGPEFVEFSLPWQRIRELMLDAQQFANEEEGRFEFPYLINDNRQVTTLEGTIKAKSLAELTNATAVRGSGGGYLSNEISYRSVHLARQHNSDIPIGHIHTPRIASFEPEKTSVIVLQLKEMLRYAIKAL